MFLVSKTVCSCAALNSSLIYVTPGFRPWVTSSLGLIQKEDDNLPLLCLSSLTEVAGNERIQSFLGHVWMLAHCHMMEFLFSFHFALFIGNICCEKDFEAVKSDSQDFRKARIEVSRWIYIWSPCEGASGGKVQQLLAPEHLLRAHNRYHLHVELIFLVPSSKKGTGWEHDNGN